MTAVRNGDDQRAAELMDEHIWHGFSAIAEKLTDDPSQDPSQLDLDYAPANNRCGATTGVQPSAPSGD